jgi:hypothetical protein
MVGHGLVVFARRTRELAHRTSATRLDVPVHVCGDTNSVLAMECPRLQSRIVDLAICAMSSFLQRRIRANETDRWPVPMNWTMMLGGPA